MTPFQQLKQQSEDMKLYIERLMTPNEPTPYLRLWLSNTTTPPPQSQIQD